jgi:hypothetical protein
VEYEVRIRGFNVTFNIISGKLLQQALLVEESEVPGEILRPAGSH